MASTEAITELLGNFKNLVKKIAYDKTEVDDKLSTKANNSLANQSSNGLMSSADKVKLDGIATGANKTVVDSSLSATSTNPVQNRVINTALNGKASTATATTSANGLMSAADKIKLNGISTEANKTIVDSALNATSTNPVQNKVINSEITSLNNSLTNHTHELGGNNLLVGTKNATFENTTTDNPTKDGTYRALQVLTIDNTNGEKYKDIVNIDYDMAKSYNEYYTLSFWLKGNPKEDGVIAYFYGYSGYVTNRVVKSIDGFTKGYSDGACNIDITSDWRRVWVTWQLNSTGDLNVTKRIRIRADIGSKASVAGIKLERGTQPSDWSPSNFDKADASHIHSRLNPTNIPQNADLNDYTTQGSFYVDANTTAQTLANCPTEEAFHLEVYRHAGVRQVLQTYPTYDVKTFERNYYNNNWSDWHRVPQDTDIASLNSTITNKVGDIQSALDKIIGV